MYVDYKTIKGILHFRNTPDGEWIQCSPKQMTTIIRDLQDNSRILWTDLQDSKENFGNMQAENFNIRDEMERMIVAEVGMVKQL